MIFENVYLFTKTAEQKGYGYEFIEIIEKSWTGSVK